MGQGDCDDSDPAISPAVTETCNAIDDNCTLLVDEDEDEAGEDTDGDGVHNVCDLDDGMIYVVFHQPGSVEWQNENGFATWNCYRGDLRRLRIDGTVSYTQDPARDQSTRIR